MIAQQNQIRTTVTGPCEKCWLLSRWDGQAWQAMARFKHYAEAQLLARTYLDAIRRRGSVVPVAISHDIADLNYYTAELERLGERYFLSPSSQDRRDLRIEIKNLMHRLTQYCLAYRLLPEVK